MLAAYNEWANERLYHAAERLTDYDYRTDVGAFFRSLHGTLNHMLVADRIWLHRFTGEGEAPNQLDAILFDDFAELRNARRAEDARILEFVRDLDDAALTESIRYCTLVSPQEIEQSLAAALLHFFNHQTHHRGQTHCLLTQLSGHAPSFDLIVFQRETGICLG
jgi:uncharacterized damage-inducible protein DinB